MAHENTRLIISNILTFFAGYVLHVLKSKRDDKTRKETAKEAAESARQGRKSNALAFLNVWASEVRDNRKVLENGVLHTVGGVFDRRKRALIKESTPVEGDFRLEQLQRFRELRDAITSMTPGGVENPDGRQNLLKAIGDFVAFLEKN